ncbi:hypothetical protein D3C77_650570 [compost metagenome]
MQVAGIAAGNGVDQLSQLGLVELRWLLEWQHSFERFQQTLEVRVKLPRLQFDHFKTAGMLRIQVQDLHCVGSPYSDDGDYQSITQHLEGIHHLALFSG